MKAGPAAGFFYLLFWGNLIKLLTNYAIQLRPFLEGVFFVGFGFIDLI